MIQQNDYCENKDRYCTAGTYYKCNKINCPRGYDKKYHFKARARLWVEGNPQ